MNCCKIWFLLLIPLQGLGQENFLRFLPEESEIKKARDCQSLRLTFLIEEGYYIQADQVLNENFIPTQVQFENKSSIRIQNILFPKAKILLLGEIEEVAVFKGEIEIWIEFEEEVWLAFDEASYRGEILYQACNKQKCFFPRTLPFEITSSRNPKLLMP